MKKTVIFFIAIVTLLTLLQGCSVTKNINPPGQLEFKQQIKSLPINVAVFIPEESKNEVIVGEETDPLKTLTTYIKCPIGTSLESNVVYSFDQIFNNVVLINNKTDIPEEINTVIEVMFNSNTWDTEMKAGGVNRTFVINLEGLVLKKDGSVVKKYSATGTTKCDKWQCFSGGNMEGEDAGAVFLKALVIPFYSYTLESKLNKLLEGALSSALKEAIDNLSIQLINDKSFLLALSHEDKTSHYKE